MSPVNAVSLRPSPFPSPRSGRQVQTIQPPRDSVEIGAVPGGNEVAAVPAASQSPDEGCFSEIGSLYQKLTGKHLPAQDQAKLMAALGDGELTREEFNQIFRAHFTKEAWHAFTGGNKVSTMGDLLYYLREFEDYNVATGVSFEYFSQCTKIIISDELTALLNSMSPAELANICKNNWETARRILSYITDSSLPEQRQLDENHASFDWASIIAQLNGQQKAKFAKMMAAALLYNLNNRAEREGIDLEDLNLSDPLMARLFGKDVFRAWATEGKSITKEQFEQLKEKKKLIDNLREMFAGNSDLNLDNLTYEGLNQVLEMIKNGKNKQEIMEVLQTLPRVNTEAPYVRVSPANPSETEMNPQSPSDQTQDQRSILPPLLTPNPISTLA